MSLQDRCRCDPGSGGRCRRYTDSGFILHDTNVRVRGVIFAFHRSAHRPGLSGVAEQEVRRSRRETQPRIAGSAFPLCRSQRARMRRRMAKRKEHHHEESDPARPDVMGTMSALAFLGAAPLAHASTPTWGRIWTPDSVTACKRLPLSEWGICKVEVVARERGSLGRCPAANIRRATRLQSPPARNCRTASRESATPGRRCTPGFKPALRRSADVRRWPRRRGTALRNGSIRAALDACHALPHSEHSSCESEATLLPHAVGLARRGAASAEARAPAGPPDRRILAIAPTATISRLGCRRARARWGRIAARTDAEGVDRDGECAGDTATRERDGGQHVWCRAGSVAGRPAMAPGCS